jgi:hypothetical protein
MQESVDELVQQLTSEEFKGKLIVILAGYENDMNEMLAVNEGLQSRFSERIMFPNFSSELIVQLFVQRFEKEGYALSTDAKAILPKYASLLTECKGFGNGRDVDTIFKNVILSIELI